ncbi:hypothetical protein WDU94_003936 [Cyamophila willieti]
MSDKDKDEEEVENKIKHVKRIKRNSSVAPKAVNYQSCQKKSLIVNFSDLGWNQWIIEPQGFQADYCTGKCSFPISKGLSPSSHAYLQSVMYLLSGTPNPCCVPDSYSPLRVLYQESIHVTVLRYFHEMKVESCACK